MNRKTLFFMVVTLVICLLPSCEKEEPKAIALDVTSWSVGLEGGSKTVQLTANTAWTATVSDSWLSVSQTSGNGGAYITVTATAGSIAEAVVLFSAGSASAKLTVKREGNPMFSVSATKQVKFSQGNLQYQASTNTWRFAEHQYDMVGANNANISSSYYSGWIDLFGWGTSGYNGKNPWMTSKVSSDYGNGNSDIAGTNYDWGGV